MIRPGPEMGRKSADGEEGQERVLGVEGGILLGGHDLSRTHVHVEVETLGPIVEARLELLILGLGLLILIEKLHLLLEVRVQLGLRIPYHFEDRIASQNLMRILN